MGKVKVLVPKFEDLKQKDGTYKFERISAWIPFLMKRRWKQIRSGNKYIWLKCPSRWNALQVASFPKEEEIKFIATYCQNNLKESSFQCGCNVFGLYKIAELHGYGDVYDRIFRLSDYD